MTTQIKARPTLYKGIQMRSRLEADFARYLDALGASWEYEPTCFADETGQWLPDFRSWLPTESGGTRCVYIEVKPADMLKGQHLITRVDAVLAKMKVAWTSEPKALLHLAFWSYGADGLDSAVLGTRGEMWQVWDGKASTVSTWPGMGQLEQLITEMPLDELNRLIDATAPGAS